MRHTTKTIIIAAAFGMVASGGSALANGDGKCFDKATLSYVDCPGGVDWSGWYLGAHAGFAWPEL